MVETIQFPDVKFPGFGAVRRVGTAMKRFMRMICGCVWLGCLVGMFGATTAPATSQGQGPRARVEEPVHDFGEVGEGEYVKHAFVIWNDGDETLELTSVRAGCGCTATEYDRQIAPGATGQVKANFNTRGRSQKTRTTVYVTTNDPRNERLTLILEGTVRRLIDVEPVSGANFGRVGDGPIEPRVVKVVSNVEQPIRLARMPDDRQSKGHEYFETRIDEREPGKVFEVTITPRQPLPEGATAVPLRFETGVKDKAELVIPCRIFLPPPLEVNPQVIFLPEPPPRDLLRPIDLIFNEEGEFEVISVTCTDARVKVTSEEIVPGKRVRVNCTVPAGFDLPPNELAQITIATNYAKQPEIKIPLRMRPRPQVPSRPVGSPRPEGLVGRPAPRVVMTKGEGKHALFGADRGEVTVLVFWSARCPHSEDHLPMVLRLAEAYRPRGVVFKLVSIDEYTPAEKIEAQTESLGVKLPIVVDEHARLYLAYHQPPLPTLLLVGKSGTVEAVHTGSEGDEAALARLEAQISAELDLLIAGKDRNAFPAPTQDPTDAGPALTITRPRIEVGQHRPGSLVRTMISYRNSSNRSVHLVYAAGTGSVNVLDGYSEELAPGAAGMARVEFRAPEESGPFAMHALLVADDGLYAAQAVTLTGTVRPYIEFAPAGGADFTRNPRVHGNPRVVHLIAHDAEKVSFERAESTSPKFTAELETIDETHAKLTVRAVPPFEPGENLAEIHVTTNHPKQGIVRVPVKLTLPPEIEVLPAEITVLDEPRVRRAGVTIRHNGEGPMRILNVSISNEKLDVQLHTHQDGALYQVLVTVPADFTPTAEGERVTLITDQSKQPKLVIPIRFETADQAAGG